MGRDAVHRERWERNIVFRLLNYLLQNFRSRINSLFHHFSHSATRHSITSYVPITFFPYGDSPR